MCGCGKLSTEFKVLDVKDSDKVVGTIAKIFVPTDEPQHRGEDRFGIDFPDDAAVEMKTVLVAACFLIDYLFFEK